MWVERAGTIDILANQSTFFGWENWKVRNVLHCDLLSTVSEGTDISACFWWRWLLSKSVCDVLTQSDLFFLSDSTYLQVERITGHHLTATLTKNALTSNNLQCFKVDFSHLHILSLTFIYTLPLPWVTCPSLQQAIQIQILSRPWEQLSSSSRCQHVSSRAM